ncbi:MAG TPA: amino acid adenylation domain-containing protein [Herpetosiphonaceae bacterium]
MSADALLSYLRGLGVEFWTDGDRLRCNAPKGVLTPALRTELAEHKAALIALLRAEDSGAPPLRPIPRDQALPLSFAQQRLWFLHQLEPDSPFYNIHVTVRFTGALDIGALEQAIGEILRRHETLRTTFTQRASADERPVQVIHPPQPIDLTPEDLRELPAPARDAEALRRAEQAARQPFDLVRGPLLRLRLLHLDDAGFMLLVTMHHIISDGWSMGIFIRELAALYPAFAARQPHPEGTRLPDLPIQYGDFAVWQRAWLALGTPGAILDRQMAYWKQQLGGALPVLDLPTDRPRPPAQSFRGLTQRFELSAPLTEALRSFSRREGVTLFMTLLTAFQIVLARYSRQDDVVVGTPISGRNRAEIEPLIGFFVNTLVLRADLRGNPSLREALGRVRAMVLAAYAHQDLPFEILVDELQPERDLSRNPLFQALFVLQNMPLPTLELPGVTLESIPVDSGTAKFDLSLAIREGPQTLIGLLEYATDLFDAATIDRLIGHFQGLLHAIVADGDQPIMRLPLLAEAERQQMLVAWNATAVDYPPDVCLHHLVEAQARRTPDAIAVMFEDAALTYAALNARANQLAHHLQALGVGGCSQGETLVGICVERSLDLVVGLLAILKAGGAYVPLDPDYPAERLRFMLEDTDAPVLVIQQHLAERLPASGVRLVCIDADGPTIAAQPSTASQPLVTADNLAYVIYTSGSTGQPKGAMNTHRAIVNRLLWMQDTYGLTAADRVLQKTPFSFDVSVWEFFWPLLTGARLVVAKPGGHQDPTYLVELIARERITTLHFVPSMLQAFLDTADLRGCRSLRRVICSGEALPLAVQQRCFARLDAELHNLYGPTEAAVDVTFWPCQRESALHTVPIGRPVANTQIYLLDRYGQPVPIGVPGELHIGGVQLARGYLGRPDLTAERFVPDPFSQTGYPQGGARLYKTGDLARFLPDGAIEYLGRLDHQVKVRGFRIELGEIEAALLQHPAVREAIVVAREDSGHTRLVAYVVEQRTVRPPGAQRTKEQAENQEPETPNSKLRTYLKERLPDYMVPSAFVFLDALPLTPNGKVDRRALPAPDTARPLLEQPFVAPETQIEITLARIWADVLQVEQVGVHDSFFALGGDSILIMQVIARAQQAGLRLKPRQMFQHQTIAALAAVVATTTPVAADQALVMGPLPLTPIQQWFFERELVDPHHWNQAILVAVRQPLDHTLLAQAVEYLLAHHDALRLRFTRTPTGWTAAIAERERQPVVTRIDLTALPPTEQTAMRDEVIAELHASLDLSDGPLLRVAHLTQATAQPDRLLFVIHHLAVDAVSWPILLEDLETAYNQLQQGTAVALPPKTTSFTYWAERLVAYAQTAAAQAELAYWLAPTRRAVAPLPVDHASGANTVASRGIVELRLSAAATDALLHAVPHVYHAQITDLLLTALVQTFAQWTGQPDLLVDLEAHGREDLFDDVELSRTVGWFTALFPMLLDLGAASDPGAALKAIKEQLRRVPSRGLGYGVLRYLSTAEHRAHLAALPQAQVMLNYLGQFDRMSATQLFSPAPEPSGPAHSPRGQRAYLIEINSFVASGQLQLHWIYSDAVHARATIERLARQYLTALEVLIAYCLSAPAAGYTPSDFPKAALSQQTLDLLVERIERGQEQAGIQPQRITDIYRLSPLQQGILFHTVSAPATGAYFEQFVWSLHGDLDLAAFTQAWQQLVDRHPILRTAFHWQELEQPVQVVLREAVMPIEHESWRSLPARVAETHLEALLRADRERGFDLAQPPLMRLTLAQTATNTWYCVWSYHHLLLDGWSMFVLLKELFQIYEAHQQSQPLRLPPARPYGDYIAWLDRQDRRAAEAAWRDVLKGFTAPTPLLRAAPADDRGAACYRERYLRFSTHTTDRLHAVARQESLTLNTIVQGAWALLLNRYSGADDLVFGVIVSGRPTDVTDFESMVGLFINTLPLRTQIDPAETLVAWLQQIQQRQFDARQYEYSSLVQIQGWSEIPRGLPLFESMIAFENYPVDRRLHELSNTLDIQLVRSVQRTNYPLTVMVIPSSELTVRMLYDAQRFDEPVIDRMMEYLHALLEGIAANPRQRIAALPLLSETDRRMLADWNATEVEYAEDACIHQLFEAQVARTPDALAIVSGDRKLSYRELDRQADLLAGYLRMRGVGPEVPVGVCVERSVDQMIGLLGILKAGGAYVPIDPAYPPDRIRLMLADAPVRVLLTHGRLLPLLPEHPARVICLDAEWSEIIQAAQASASGSARQRPTADNLAYVIYTSGSTGKPKGVMLPHRGLCNLIPFSIQMFGIRPGDRIAQLIAYSFDGSIWECLISLLAGATMYIGSQEHLLPGPTLQGWLHDHAISATVMVPSMLGGLDPQALPALRTLICGGEAISHTMVARWSAGRRFFNSYGPTEATVNVTVWESDPTYQDAPPIGRPNANTRVYLLDRHLLPVPIGVVGELYVGGVQLARGYLGRPDLTAERFVPDPFADQPGGRLYRTGDLACYLPDGNIEFLGRIDHQVKVRGYRIELGEIEAALIEYPAVQDAVVVVREDAPGERRLVAYVVEQRTTEQRNKEAESDDPCSLFAQRAPVLCSPQELRQHVGARLPAYMVPSVFVLLDALPLLPNGKLDRKALPVPEAQRPNGTVAYVAPRTAIERQIAQIWKDVLELDDVGIHDNFFDLGGHSLRMMQVHGKLCALLKRDIPMMELFRYPTITALTSYVSAVLGDSAAEQAERQPAPRPAPAAGTEIAIIGMSGRFPGAKHIETFWHNLQAGTESITFFDDDALLAAGVDPARLADPQYVKAGAILDGIELFDAAFFGYSPREATVMDPQQRFFLECTWEALEHAGYNPEASPGRIGVYAGVGTNSYLLNNLYPNRSLLENVGAFQMMILNEKDHLTTRVAYKLNLHGPAINLQTACSTSLVAVIVACQNLLLRQCDMALAGGVTINVPHAAGYRYVEGGIASPDGHCRAFDARAEGTVAGNGIGVVVLKRLSDALADGDAIQAVIKGFAMNNDGSQKVGYTAPSIDGQAAVIAEALAMAGVSPETISYIETHGTGTRLGDPIEMAALTRVFEPASQRNNTCAIGSVKTNIGHLDTAAGVTGLIKTVLALQHRCIPPSLHFEQPNPMIDFARSPFYVNTSRAEWHTNGTPRRAGVSSFGIGGTNAHVVLEEAPPVAPSGSGRKWQLVALSARSSAALERAALKLAAHLRQHPDLNLADVAYTLHVGRQAFAYRQILVCRDSDDAVELLESQDPRQVLNRQQERQDRAVVFLFPGQGAQYVQMAHELYHEEAAFREQVDRCAELLRPHLGLDLRTVLYPDADHRAEATQQLHQTWLTQPVLFVIEYALAQLWMSWGVQPVAMIGHSIGEYVAACLAGVFSLEDALALVSLRGRLIQSLPAGAMLSVPLPEQTVLQLLDAEDFRQLSLAAVNAPALCVVAGPHAGIEQLERQLAEQGLDCRRLHTSHAFHSAMIEPILEPFIEQMSRISLHRPRLPYLSNVSGTWITAEDATDPRYWARHLRAPVRFATSLEVLLSEPDRVLLEIGPGRMLSTLARQQAIPNLTVLSSLRHPHDRQQDLAFLLQTLGQLWLAGVPIDWTRFYADQQRRRVHLPTYPFERQRYWIDPPSRAARSQEQLLTPNSALSDGAPPSEALHGRPALATAYVAPRNAIEHKIAAIWQDLLGIASVGIHDNFFDLGGHSLMATLLVSRLREVFPVDVPVRELFEAGTVAGVAEIIEARLIEKLNDLSEDEARLLI